MMLTEGFVLYSTLMVKHRKGISVALLAGSALCAAGRGYAVMACGSRAHPWHTGGIVRRVQQNRAAANYVRWLLRSACTLHDLTRSTRFCVVRP